MSLRNRFVFICISLLTLFGFTYIKVSAETPNLTAADLLTVSASWNGNTLHNNATSSIPLASIGTLSWDIGYNASNTDLTTYLPKIRNAVYTIQLYKGTIGNSLLIDQQTISNGSATSSGAFRVSFPGSGAYFLAYTATYPVDQYPIGSGPESCHGDFCILPRYSLEDFQTFVTSGEQEDKVDYGYPIPALFGITTFIIAPPPGPKASNVLFLPGMMESRLYKNVSGHEKMIWEPTRNKDIALLALNGTGKSEQTIYTRDVVDYLYSQSPALAFAVRRISKDAAELYGPFESFMDQLVTEGTISHWEAYPYDWRFGADEIVRDGTLIGDSNGLTHRVFLQKALQGLASNSPTGKVTIIAHSNGGLIAKALAVDLEKSGKIGLIDRIIMVGTPQIGTPMTIGNLLHGDDQTRALGLVTSGIDIRTQAANMPGVYGLLPSALYFSLLSSPVATFGTQTILKPYLDSYGSPITATSSLTHFLLDSAHVRTPSVSDLRIPAILNSSVLNKALVLHDSIDAWVPPPSVSLVSIIGIGQSTIFGYAYGSRIESTGCTLLSKITLHCKKRESITHEPLITDEGDNTVVFISAAANPGERIYFDTAAYLQNKAINIVHQSLLSAAPVQQHIRNILENITSNEMYLSTTTPLIQTVPDSMVISVHSPMHIEITDTDGRETGVFQIPETDFSLPKQEIPGSSIQTIDDEEYVYVPAGKSYSLYLHGYDVGLTTLEIGHTKPDGSIQNTYTFEDIPTTASTTAQTSLGKDSLGPVSVDVDGNGFTDTTISASSDRISSSESLNTNMKHSGQSQILPLERLSVSYKALILALIQLKEKLLELLKMGGLRRNHSTMA